MDEISTQVVSFAVRRFLTAFGLSLLMLSPAFADARILASPGGKVGNYLNFFSQVRRSGERVIQFHVVSVEGRQKDGLLFLGGEPLVWDKLYRPCARDVKPPKFTVRGSLR